jgi:hypothetical protein
MVDSSRYRRKNRRGQDTEGAGLTGLGESPRGSGQSDGLMTDNQARCYHICTVQVNINYKSLRVKEIGSRERKSGLCRGNKNERLGKSSPTLSAEFAERMGHPEAS